MGTVGVFLMTRWRGTLRLWLLILAAFLVGHMFDLVHQNTDSLSNSNRDLIHKITTGESTCSTEKIDLRIAAAQDQTKADTLSTQNRDQQNTINRCQQEALNLMRPPEQRTTALVIGTSTSPDGLSRTVNYLLLTNKDVEPVHMKTKCDADVALADMGSIGVSGLPPFGFGNSSHPTNDGSWEIDIASPAWTPTAPFMATIQFSGIPRSSNGQPRIPSCDFDPQ